jgi:uncharacterized membrane protein
MPSGASPRARIESIDVVRGAIMILMALDHTRDFFGASSISPTDPAHASVALFFTRWITHFCAPVFFLLTGTGASLMLERRTVHGVSWFLFTRGVWLIVLELTVIRCIGFQFNVDYHVTMLIVLWALGWAMIGLAPLVFLPTWAVAAYAVVMIAGHDLLDTIRSTNPMFVVLHGPGVVWRDAQHLVFASYPLVPWLGVTALGFVLGRVYRWTPERRRRLLTRAGLAMSMAFVAVRAVNVYGDPVHWRTQNTPVHTLLSFLNATKYPPSLLFLLMTLGPAFLMLAAVDRATPSWLRPAITYGRVPMFYFVLHLPLIHLIAVAVCYARYGAIHWMFESPNLARYPFTAPPGWGYPLPIVYAIWIVVVVSLYPACRWFGDVKARRRDAWLSYF